MNLSPLPLLWLLTESLYPGLQTLSESTYENIVPGFPQVGGAGILPSRVVRFLFTLDIDPAVLGNALRESITQPLNSAAKMQMLLLWSTNHRTKDRTPR